MHTDKTILGLSRETWFQAFKYTVYIICFGNFLYFLFEDMAASAHTFRGGISFMDYVNAFAASTDTLAWLVLLIVFELETWVIPDDKFTPTVNWTLRIVSGVCYAFILAALNGYVEKSLLFYNFSAAELADACAYVGNILSAGVYLEEYETLSLETCMNYAAPLFINTDLSMLTTADGLSTLRRLAVLDVVNATAWVLIVIILAIDVYLQAKGKLTERLYDISKRFKYVLYSTLIVCAVYWAFLEDVMGTWDAMVWIIAFFFIEMNVQMWHDEEAEALNTANGGDQ